MRRIIAVSLKALSVQLGYDSVRLAQGCQGWFTLAIKRSKISACSVGQVARREHDTDGAETAAARNLSGGLASHPQLPCEEIKAPFSRGRWLKRDG